MENRLLTHSPIDFHFVQNSDDFVVEEVPLYEYSGEGEHLIVRVRKKGLSTMEMIQVFSEVLGVKNRDIGYAGLKDKNGLTIQDISLPATYQNEISKINHKGIKILSTNKHNNKLKIGHLKGNKFFVRLKKILKIENLKIIQAIKAIEELGFPNYFGYQRFGKDKNNFDLGKTLSTQKQKHKIDKFMVSAYQSHLFNQWLSKRVEISKVIKQFSVNEAKDILKFDIETLNNLKKQKHFFKLLLGDIMCHYPHGKFFENLGEDELRFLQKDIVPTGVLCGNKVQFSKNIAFEIEKEFLDLNIKEVGARRFAWIFLDSIEYRYKEEVAQGELNFYLPKGSYATTLLEMIANRNIDE